MGQPALKIARPLPSRPLTVLDLPFQAAANSNVEIVESFAQKFLRIGGKILGHALFYTQFLDMEGDTPQHPLPSGATPIIDPPPMGKTPPQWLADMEEAIRVATQIGQKQIEILQHQRNGQIHLTRRTQQELDELVADTQSMKNSSGVPFTSGALRMVASADGLSSTATSNIFSADAAETTPNAAAIAAILEGNPSEITTPTGKYLYDITDVAAGNVRYPRLETLVDLLVGSIPHPTIIERGPGRYGHLAVSVARRRPIIVIERLRDTAPILTGVPGEIRSRIRVIDFKDAPRTPTADLAIWIHPYPNLLRDDDDVLDPDYMGQDVRPGGYVVIQTEKENLVMPETPNWELVYIGRHMGFLAPSHFSHGRNTTLVLRRTTAVLPTTWHELADTHPKAFVVRAQQTIDAARADLRARIHLGIDISVINAWFQHHVRPELEKMSAVFRTLLSQQPTVQHLELARVLRPWTTLIPVWLMEGRLTELLHFIEDKPLQKN